MASSKLSDLPSATPASADLLYIVDVSDTTDSPDGSSKKTTVGDVLLLSPVTSVAGRTGSITLTSTDISDSTATGRAVMTAADAAAARSAIGAGTGNALTSGTLGQFAATTSAELAGVLTDETGSGGGFVRATGPTLTTPSVSGTLAVYQTGQSGASTARVDVYHDGSNAWLVGGSGLLVVDSATAVQVQKQITVAASVVGLSDRGFALYPSVGMRLEAISLVGWSSGTNATAAPEIAIARLDANTVEINNGTRTASGGALRGLSVSTLTASGGVWAGGASSVTPAAGRELVLAPISGSTTGITFQHNGTQTVYLRSATLGTSNGQIEIGNNLGTTARFGFGQATTPVPTLALRQWSGQTTSLLQCENNAGTTVASVSAGGNITTSGVVFVGTYTVATLPSASANAGAFAQVTDSNSTTNGNTVAGGGANRVPVFSNGTNWIIK